MGQGEFADEAFSAGLIAGDGTFSPKNIHRYLEQCFGLSRRH
ncbi:MAG: hypothetical protein WKG07_07495 [Hymenobacter sp.]